MLWNKRKKALSEIGNAYATDKMLQQEDNGYHSGPGSPAHLARGGGET